MRDKSKTSLLNHDLHRPRKSEWTIDDFIHIIRNN